MSAAGLQVVTLAFPDPTTNNITSSDFKSVDGTISYSTQIGDSIQTLSTTNAAWNRNIDGLLFTPELPDGACAEAAQYISPNATRPDNLPADDTIAWIAIAPWINKDCTIAFFNATRNSPTIQAFLFYLTDNSTGLPPKTNSETWSLDDGGRWKTTYRYPVYAIPSVAGQAIMDHLADYSGNLTDVPNGDVISRTFPASDYVRLGAELGIRGANKLPSLWIFLLIVIGILLVIIACTSGAMHIVQLGRRRTLRRRVLNGEVDLEALGIKRITVPQEIIDKIPLYTYSDKPIEVEKTATGSPGPSSTLHASHFSQGTCPICLEDYESGVTTVRELPCRHLFHPECVDTFLLQNSSLCPMCKKSALPAGYCPAHITNAMVRRERMVRRIQERRPFSRFETAFATNRSTGPRAASPSGLSRMREAMRNGVSNGRRVFSAPARSNSRVPGSATAQDVELRSTSTPLSNSTPGTTAEDLASPIPAHTSTLPDPACLPLTTTPPPSNTQSRREWARQRAVNMLGQRERRQTIIEAEIEAEAARRPLWRRGLGKIWPGFA